MAGSGQALRSCWCGDGWLTAFSADHLRCASCGTLVSQSVAGGQAPGQNTASAHENPGRLGQRARWLRALLAYRLPPARVRVVSDELGLTALLALAGYDCASVTATTESVDVVVLEGGLERLANPVAVIEQYSRGLAPDGLLMIQTPEFREWLTHEEMQPRRCPRLDQALPQAGGPLHLFSKRAARALLGRLGFPFCRFETPPLPSHLFCIASPQTVTRADQRRDAHLAQVPLGSLMRELSELDTAVASLDRNNVQLIDQADALRCLVDALAAAGAANQRLQEQLAASQADRADRLEVIQKLDLLLKASEAARQKPMRALVAERVQARAVHWKKYLRRVPHKVAGWFGAGKRLDKESHS